MNLEVMQILWYLIIGASFVFYVILDGFDLGVGLLQIFGGSDHNRRVFLNSIGPFWDGNEVWLIIIAGGLFVGFPDVYSIVFSGFYDLFMALLMGIIFRAVAIEFRSKMPGQAWRNFWDGIFWFSSLVITFGLGILLGNLLQGLPIGADRELYFSFAQLFTPYTFLVGALSIALFMMHGNHFLLMKTEGVLQKKLRKWAPWTITLFCLFFFIVTALTWRSLPDMVKPYSLYAILWIVPALLTGSIVAMMVATYKEFHGYAFAFSMLTITFLFLLFAIGTFPNFVISTINKSFYSLTLYNASASQMTLTVALTIALIGVPLVVAYGWLLYYIFRGKTKLHTHSY